MSKSAHFIIMYSIGKGGHVEKPLVPTLILETPFMLPPSQAI